MEIFIIVVLTLLNGAFAMSEMALAASKKARLASMAEQGDHGAQAALQLMKNPTQFLSTVQVGITSIGMLNGIVGEAAFSTKLEHQLTAWGLAPATAGIMATAFVVVVITFITILFGELVPKRIGQLYPEPVARVVARPMQWVARMARPFVHLLSAATMWCLRLLHIDANRTHHVTEEEIEASLEEGVGAGIIEQHEHQMLRNVFLLDDRNLASIMRPRADIQWIDAALPLEQALYNCWQHGHSWYPVCRGDLRDVLGIVHVPKLLEMQHLQRVAGVNPHWHDAIEPAVFVPETLTAMEMLAQLRQQLSHMVMVVDEYGAVQGLLTPLDMLEAITGELSATVSDAWATPQADGSWHVVGAMPVHELKARLKLDNLPDEDKDLYNTVAGLMQTVAGSLLALGDRVLVGAWQFEVLQLDGRRIAMVRIAPMTQSD